jgi:competence protein ComEC
MKLPLTLCAALAAALAYYSGLGIGLLALAFVLTAFLRVLACSPALFFGQDACFPALFFVQYDCRRAVRVCNAYGIALAIGVSAGLAAGCVKPLRLGLVESSVNSLHGSILDDPRVLTSSAGLGAVALRRVSTKGGISASASGSVPVFFPEATIPRLKTFGRGSELYIEGDFLTPKADGSPPVFRAHSVHIIRPPPPIEQLRTDIRLNILRRFSAFHWGGLAAALLLGVKDELATTLADAYRDAGCSHVLALSGMHLAIIAGLLALLLKKPLGLKLATLTSAFGIALYVYLVGKLPSLNRAAVMYLLGTVTVLKMLPLQCESLLGLAFLIQLCFQPEAVQTLSFILSYLALLGIIFLGELVYRLMRGFVPDVLARPLAASLGAFISTAAVVAARFGMLRPIGIVAGLLIIPLTSMFMLAVILFLATGAAAPIASIAAALYDALAYIAALAARIPGVSVSKPVSALVVSILAAGTCAFLCYKHTAREYMTLGFD